MSLESATIIQSEKEHTNLFALGYYMLANLSLLYLMALPKNSMQVYLTPRISIKVKPK